MAKFQLGGASLIELIGRIVTGSRFCPNGELEFRLDSDATLRILLNSQGFDSFDLTFKN